MNDVLNYVIPIGAGVTVGTIIVVVAVALLKGLISRLLAGTFSPKKQQDIADISASKAVEKLNGIHFKQSVAPIARSEFVKIREEAELMWKEKYDLLDEKFNKAVKVVECFAGFFENAIGVPDEKKIALKKAIDDLYVSDVKNPEILEIKVEVEDTEKTATQPQETPIMAR